MPKCQSCAANYDDNFRYCPYCGTAKPTPQVVLVQGADPRLYEEGVLRLKCMLETQVIGSYKGWFGKTGEWQESLRIGHFELIAISHERGEYVAMTSAAFRHLLRIESRYGPSGYLGGYEPKELEVLLRSAYDYIETGRQYARSDYEPDAKKQVLFETLFREQKNAWEGFCTSLQNEGWCGMTDEAIGRKLPRSGNGGWWSILAQYPSGRADIQPRDPYKEPYYDESDRLRTYRYRRQT